MATLNNPINAQNIVDRFADYVVASANSGISWGTNSSPFAEFNTAEFGGDTNGRGISIGGSAVSATPITASTIYNALVNETQTFSNIRNLRAILFVDGGGGNTGTRPTPGTVYDQTAVAHLNTGYRQAQNGIGDGGVASGNTISVSNLQQFFANCQAEYLARRGATATIQVNVCHASCHSSCHSSRGRR
jgi:hypothetical protein